MRKVFLVMSLIGVPLVVLGAIFHWSNLLMFLIDCLTVVALAYFMGVATESLAIIAGPSVGGLLNATFGNAAEIIIAIFALQAGLTKVVLASLTGSILGNLLLVGGLSFLIGGLKYKRQRFNVHEARHNAGLLLFGIIVAFVFPYIFSNEVNDGSTQIMSIAVAIILMVIYLCGLFFKLVTHRGVYKNTEKNNETEKSDSNQEEKPEFNGWWAFGILAISTIAVAYVSENLVHQIEPVALSLGWSKLFIGIIIVAIVGNAAEHSTAIIMAYKDKMNVAVEIAVGSSLQIAMFGAPLLVLLSLWIDPFMPLIFTTTELIAMVLSALLVITLTNDGDTNWFEGALLLAAYIIMGMGFFLL